MEIEFEFNASEILKEKTIVAFEDLHREGRHLASNADINDEKQTVRIPGRSVPPKTGDDTPLWLYTIIFTAALIDGAAFAIKETIERRKQHKEDMEMFA